ncbi:triple functional domain protein-like isoform X2 [Paramacrobiotus metropolitanus]|uniref:triple functional domain protein-like isoform X2 n=1 Tax=Paramacrobiotus metropolitanus TaxID=2943436 RepID=UPI002445AD09|nr:triple functional domain protein-like isoform X2 [Paramacrobiotus metropolitanus]
MPESGSRRQSLPSRLSEAVGWPLCANGRVIIHLCELDPEIRPITGTSSILRPGECYFHIARSSSQTPGLVLCLKLRTSSGELIDLRIPPQRLSMAFSQKWFEETISAHDSRLLGALQFCVVSFERSIERIDLQLLTSGWQVPFAPFPAISSSASCSCSNLTSSSNAENTLLDNELICAPEGVHEECQCLCRLNSGDKGNLPAVGNPDPPDPPDAKHAHLPLNSRSQPFPPESAHQSGRNENPGSSNRANLINELHSELMLSGAMTFPGILDRQQHPVIFMFGRNFPVSATDTDVADVFCYFYFIPRESVSRSGFTVVVDMCFPNDSVISQAKFLNILDEAIHKTEQRIQNAIHKVLVIIHSETPIEMADQIRDELIKSSSLKITFVHGRDELRIHMDDMNIITELGGRLNFNHQKFVAYRKEIEPFIETCRHASRRLLEALQELRLLDSCSCQYKLGGGGMPAQQMPPTDFAGPNHPHITAAHFNVMIQAQKKMMQSILEDKHLLQLQTTGDAMLIRFQQDQMANMEAKDSYDQASQIYSEVHSAAVKLARLADKRLAKLEKAYHVKRFEEDARKVLAWLCKKGEDGLARYSITGENLNELRQQQREFEKFYFTASHQLEKGSDLVEEFSNTEQADYPTVAIELCRALKDNLKKFADRLDDVRDRIDDTARCYCLVERAFEWTLNTINFMSQFKLEPEPTLLFLNEHLQKMESYVRVHPALTKDNFKEMDQIAARLKVSKLSEQCIIAKNRCQEAEALVIAKETSFLKAKFALIPVKCLDDTAKNRASPFSAEVIPYRNFRQPSIPEMDETSSSSEPPFIDADSVTGTDSLVIGSVSSVLEDYPTALDVHVERRNKTGNMKRSLTWQAGECSRASSGSSSDKSSGNSEENEGKFSAEDFAHTDKARVNRRESWTVPTSNSHLLACLPKDTGNAVSGSAGAGLDSAGHYGSNALLVMQELIQTELDYVTALRFVIDNYLPEIFRDSLPQVLRGKRNVVFGNLSKILEFHENEFSHTLESCASSPFHIGQVFLQFEKQFYLYALYTHNKPKSDELMAECGNEYFKTKQIALQDKMDLSSYLLRPVQRMGKYALLLKQLLKVCPRSDPEWADLQAAEEMVKFQLRHGNDLLAMDLLKDCDVNLKEQGRLLRQDDMVVWQAGKKKSVKRVFLFEELILFSKTRRLKNGNESFVYKFSLKTNDIGLTEQLGDSLTKLEIWFRKRKLGDNFILQAASCDIKQAWTRDISSILWNQAFRSKDARLAEMTCMGIGSKACLDIKPSEDQINHRFVNLRALGRFRDGSSSHSIDFLSSGSKHPRPHSVISLSSSSTNGSTLVSGPMPISIPAWAPQPSSSFPDDPNESPRRSQCSSESGICSDMVNSSSPVDSDSSK